MSRVVVVHWRPEEARAQVRLLRTAGHQVSLYSEQGGVGLRALRNRPPDVFVIDLDRLPSHGTAVATFLRQQAGTRAVPIVFVGGAPDKVARVRRLLPDATYAAWRGIRSALRRATRRPAGSPVVPGMMQPYTQTPLAKKLRFDAGSTVVLLGAPADFERTLGALPEGVRLLRTLRGRPTRILLFADSLRALAQRFPRAARALADGGALWIAWPKRSSGVPTDLTQAAVRDCGLRAGFVDYKICSIDSTWSGLLFARRGAR